MQQIDLQPFKNFMRTRSLVDERRLSFYLSWVLRFLRCEFDHKRLSPHDLLLSFSDQLARDDQLENWQRRQAMNAVELYLNVYLPTANGTPAVSTQDLPVSNCESALHQMKELLQLRHYSPRTQKTYTGWVDRYFRYAAVQKQEWNAAETMRAYLSFLATHRNVAASTQNQAFNALLFLFRETLQVDLPEINAVRAKRGPKLPVVLSADETQRILSHTEGTTGLMLKLTYGGGLRVSETVRLRVQDLDFGNENLMVRSGKGDKDRATILPASLRTALQGHLKRVRALHEEDLKKGFGAVWLPGALARKYPNAPTEWR